jgi:hypothetical protein
MQKKSCRTWEKTRVLRLTQMLLAILLHREKGPVQIPRKRHVNNQNPETNEHSTNLEGKTRSPGNPGDVTLQVKI